MFIKSLLRIGTRTLGIALPIVDLKSQNVPDLKKYTTCNLNDVELLPTQNAKQIADDIRFMEKHAAAAIFNVVDYKGFYGNQTLLSGRCVDINEDGKPVEKADREKRAGLVEHQRKLHVSAKIMYVLPNAAQEFNPKTCDSLSFSCRLSDAILKDALGDNYQTVDYYRQFDNEVANMKEKINVKSLAAARRFVPLPSLETVDQLLGL